MTQVRTNAAQAAGGIPAADLARGAAPINGFSGGSRFPGILPSALAAEKPPISRAAARLAGLRYFFGRPCHQGHTRRYVASGKCVTCRVAAAKGYQRTPRPSRAKSRPPEVIAESRPEALKLGTVKYHGRPHTCGATVRYALTSKCVKCQRARVAKKRAAA